MNRFTSRRLSVTQIFSLAHRNNSSTLCKKLAILGGGNMAEAIISSLLIKKQQPVSNIHVTDINEARLAGLYQKYNVNVNKSILETVNEAEIIILAVKPQNVNAVGAALKGKMPTNSLLISIAAGVTIDTLRNAFETDKIIRSMPNTPASILEGITVWNVTKATPDELVQKAKLLLGSFGEEIQVSDEEYLDMATAVSGSGPAYIFLLMESLIDAAVHVGFPRAIAVRLVAQTIKGSAAYAQTVYEKEGKSVSELRYNVTSPGGTTASALYELEKGGFRTVMSDAIWAAYRRTLELGGKNPNIGPGRNKF